jgi:hypothetical protein
MYEYGRNNNKKSLSLFTRLFPPIYIKMPQYLIKDCNMEYLLRE